MSTNVKIQYFSASSCRSTYSHIDRHGIYIPLSTAAPNYAQAAELHHTEYDNHARYPPSSTMTAQRTYPYPFYALRIAFPLPPFMFNLRQNAAGHRSRGPVVDWDRVLLSNGSMSMAKFADGPARITLVRARRLPFRIAQVPSPRPPSVIHRLPSTRDCRIPGSAVPALAAPYHGSQAGRRDGHVYHKSERGTGL
ncbi:hypothetical protein D9615_010556 [Tricholomella constricta]|uniref:Uncharacterized protein n=1 Tax=Tricholomella constricta TaxID=117010 RepID=A0A8H5H5J7_9AGAR|nr:hypothetical protein D9615_010556 [Tricholomella constricta]